MLKIRDDIDLKELKKYGFTIIYDKYSGEPEGLYQQWGYPYCDSVEKPFIKFIKKRKCNIFYKNTKSSFFGMSVSYPKNRRNEEIFLDTIYRLIKDGLVEKVD